MEIILICILAAYSAAMTYLRLTAAKTATTVDDKVLAIGEKVEPVVDFVRPKVTK